MLRNLNKAKTVLMTLITIVEILTVLVIAVDGLWRAVHFALQHLL